MTYGRILDMKPALPEFRKEVIASLSDNPKWIHPKFFYDRKGSDLFDAITWLPEYYLTRAETEILTSRCGEIAALTDGVTRAMELGPGMGRKSLMLLRCIGGLKEYVLLDISMQSLEKAVELLEAEFPQKEITGICSDYLSSESLPMSGNQSRSMIVFLGSTIGNMETSDAERFLASCSRQMKNEDLLFIGVDMKKDLKVLLSAYNDSSGVTAEFNLNLIRRISEEFGVDIPEGTFMHRAVYNESLGRIEMHLDCKADLSLDLEGTLIRFREGESIHTESSYKYSPEEFGKMLLASGFSGYTRLSDSRDYYSVFIARK